MKVNLEAGNIADNLNSSEEFAEVLEIILLPSWKGTSQKQDEKSNLPAQGMKSYMKMSNVLKTLKRGLKKVNVELKQILKKRQKKKAQEIKKNAMERFRETWKR